MKMLHKSILLFILLLQAGAGFAAPGRDSIVAKIIEKGKVAFQALAKQNQLNEENGQSEQNHYVLNISTDDLFGDRKIETLDKEYIKQRKITYSINDVGQDIAGSFFVPDGEKLNELDKDLREYNLESTTKVRAYLIMIDFVPMIFNNPPPDMNTLMTYWNPDSMYTENGNITMLARQDAARIVKGIAAEYLQDQPEGGAKAAFNNVCCGFINYKIYDKKDKLRNLKIFSVYCDLPGDELNSYNLLITKHLPTIKKSEGPEMIEGFIDAIINNNRDYNRLPSVMDKILSITDNDEMVTLLGQVSDKAYDQFTYEQRIHAIKVLSSRGGINTISQQQIVSLLSTADLEKDAGNLLADLAKPNEYVAKKKSISDGAFDQMEVDNEYSKLTLLHLLVDGIMDPLIGPQNYTALTQFFINLGRSSPTVFDDALAYYRDPNKLSRTIIWDKSYALEFFSTPPAGTNSYDVSFDSKTDEITFTKSQLRYYDNNEGYNKLRQSIMEYSEDRDSFLKKFLTDHLLRVTNTLDIIGYYDKTFPPAPQWVEEPSVKLKPWDLVSFTNKSDLSLLAAAVGESAEQKEHQAQFMPAIVLKYAADKKFNKNVGKGVNMAFDVIVLVTPVGELAYMGEVANYIYKFTEYGTKLATLGHLATETGAIDKDSKLGKLIDECYTVANLLQLGNAGLSLTNGVIAKLSRAEATKFLSTYYEAEKEGLMYLMKDPEAVKRIVRFKRELEEAGVVAGYGKNWFVSVREQVYQGVTNTVAKVKSFKFMTAVAENKLIRFVDGKGNTVMHTMADGTLVLDKAVVTMEQDAHLLTTMDAAAIRTAENAPEIVEDIMFVQRADKSIQCVRGACFIAGTPVHTKAGLIPIEQIKEKDTVLGVYEGTGATTWQTVTRTFKKQASKLVRIVAGSDTIYSTPEHPYLTENGWKSAVDLTIGGRLRLDGKAFVTLTAILAIDTAVTVYNFETAITHSYCVGKAGMVVHNSCAIFEKLKNSIPDEHFDEFVNDFKDAADLVAKFDNGKLSINAWEILYKYPSFRSQSTYLHQIEAVLKKSTDPKCGATIRDIMAGKQKFGALNDVDRDAIRKQFEMLQIRGRSASNEVLVADMTRYLDEIRDVWMAEGIAARVAKIGKLAEQYDGLTQGEKLAFNADFVGANPKALEQMAGDPSFLLHWKTDRAYYKGISYANMSHADWGSTAAKVIGDGNPLNTGLANDLSNLTLNKEDIVAAAIYQDRPGGSVLRYNADAPAVLDLSPMFQRRIAYMELIYKDAENGGTLYQTLYKDVPLQKVINAGSPGRHAEVLAVDVLAKELKIAAPSGLSRIHVMVRGGKYGSMCRCPHCFYILQGVEMVGNR